MGEHGLSIVQTSIEQHIQRHADRGIFCLEVMNNSSGKFFFMDKKLIFEIMYEGDKWKIYQNYFSILRKYI